MEKEGVGQQGGTENTRKRQGERKEEQASKRQSYAEEKEENYGKWSRGEERRVEINKQSKGGGLRERGESTERRKV